MYDFIRGKVHRLTPTEIVVDCNGVGYVMHISLNTFEKIKSKKDVEIFTHLVVREDSQTLYGFAEQSERELYIKLLGVNGVGPSTGRMILSSMGVNDVVSAITNGNIAALKSIKGIGPKAAQRLVIELQDKLGGIGSETAHQLIGSSAEIESATDALIALGFGKATVGKVLMKISSQEGNNLTAEELIKKSLQIL